MAKRAYCGARFFSLYGPTSGKIRGIMMMKSDGVIIATHKQFGGVVDDLLSAATDEVHIYVEPEEMLEGYNED